MSTSKPKVLVAMSGGVDSSVAAAFLVRESYEVVGCFMRLGSPGETLGGLVPADEACDTEKVRIGHKGCCSVGDAADARLVAAELGIPFYVCNFKRDFNRIIDYFVDEYAMGRTPNPCVRCNDWLKFGKLHAYAKQIGAEFVASGHYARIDTTVPPTAALSGWCEGHGEHRPKDALVAREPRLLRGVDASKDQSYVLFGAPRDRLREMMLPIGEFEKPRVRELAQEFGLPVFDKPDSQEICFVPDDDYAGLVERRRPETVSSGAILDTAGNRVGEHAGQHRFTIGQRRGVGVALGRPIYVVDKDPDANTITIGDERDLLVGSCIAGEANWLVDADCFSNWTPCHAKFRYNSPAVPARVRTIPDIQAPTPSGRSAAFEVAFDEPQRAVAPGQALVIYDADEPDWLLAGGWIARCEG